MSTIASKGLPPRGSLQDRIVCEMLFRMRRRRMAEVTFIGRILAASTLLPENQYQFLADMLAMEVFQENYTPKTVQFKKNLIQAIDKRKKDQTDETKRSVEAAKRLDIKEEDFRPLTPAELESYRRKFRKIKLKQATSKIAKDPDKK